MRTVYLGTSEFAAAVLTSLADSDHRPQLVISRPDSHRGRGRSLQSPPVAQKARELRLELLQPQDLHAEEVLATIAAVTPDVLCVCAFGVILRAQLLDRYEMLNVHPSLLPRWRGAAPIERAIMAGDEQTGVSIMRVTEGLDSGPVYIQARERIDRNDDFGTLSRRLESLGARLLITALDSPRSPEAQNDAQATYAEKISPADRLLDFTHTIAQIERQVRALRPHIGARITLPNGDFLGVWSVKASDSTGAKPGQVHTSADTLIVNCADGAVELVEIQPAGGKRMAAAQWLRGRPDPALTNFSLADLDIPERSAD